MISDNVVNYIPQRPPMVLVSRLLSSDELKTTAELDITENNIFVDGGVLSEPGIVEHIAQCAALRAGFQAQQEQKPVSLGYIGAVNDLSIAAFPSINSTITTTITQTAAAMGAVVISAAVLNGNMHVASCIMKIFIKESPKENSKQDNFN